MYIHWLLLLVGTKPLYTSCIRSIDGVNLPTFNNRLQHLIASFVLHRSVQLPLHHLGLSLPWDVCWLWSTQHAWSGRLDSLDQKTPKLYFFSFFLFIICHIPCSHHIKPCLWRNRIPMRKRVIAFTPMLLQELIKNREIKKHIKHVFFFFFLTLEKAWRVIPL